MVASSSEHKDIKRGVPLGLKLYGIVGFVFLCFIAVSVYGLFQLKDALESQRSAELKHLTELAVKAVREEYEASQSGAISASKRPRTGPRRVWQTRVTGKAATSGSMTLSPRWSCIRRILR